MGSFQLFGKELSSLKNRKGLLFALIGVLLIPIVYVAVLLSATWGPYDNLDNLPVAVVNKDAGGVSSGQPINVGNDLVATLKESKTLGWDFVSEEEALKGLDDQKYYMVVEIPEDFSQKVTTVLDANPQVPELRYIQNEGLNFMGSQVTNSAVERIREQLGDKITATYARTVFSKFTDIETGFASGADGSQQIHDGTVKLAEGTNTLLSSLTEKSEDINKLAVGAKTADAGAGELLSAITGGTSDINKLANGSQQVATGVGDVKSGSQQVLTGLKSLQGGSNQLLGGLNSAKDGSSQVLTGLEAVEDGSSQVLNGIVQVRSGSGELLNGLTSLEGGSNQVLNGLTALNDGSGQVLAGLYSASAGSQELLTGLGTLQAGSNQIYGGLVQLQPGTQELLGGLQQLSNGANELSTGINNQLAPGAAQLASLLEAKQAEITQLAGAASLLQQLAQTPGLEPYAGNLQVLAQGLTELGVIYPQAVAGAKGLNTGVQTISGKLPSLNTGLQQAVGGQTTIASGVNELVTGQVQVLGGINKLVEGQSALSTGLKQLVEGQTSAVEGVGKLVEGQTSAITGVNQLKTGQAQAIAGLDQLVVGQTSAVEGVGKLKAGQSTLNAGLDQLVEGQTSAVAGVDKLVAGQSAIVTGATKLESGATQVAGGNKSLTGSWNKLGSGVSSLKTGLTQISTGNETVATGWQTMTEGVTALNDGANRLQAGSTELATGLEGGAEQVAAVKVTDENIAMFSTPVVLSGEKVNRYEYYRDSTAPYILSLALFVGMLVLSFFVDFKKPAVLPKSVISWYVSKWLQLALFATIQALLVALFTLFVLQLSVQNAGMLILFAILVSITFMSIIFFLVSAAGNVGRFIALVLVVAQLSITGSNLPIPMLPENLQSVSAYLPFTYSISGFKSVISLGDLSLLASNSGVLAIYLIGGSVLAFVAFIIGYKTLTTKYKPEVQPTV